MNVCAYPGCDVDVGDDRHFACLPHYRLLPSGAQRKWAKAVKDGPARRDEERLWSIQRARCIWAGVPAGAVDLYVDHGADLDAVIADALDAIEHAVASGAPREWAPLIVNPNANWGHVPWADGARVICKTCTTPWPCDDSGPLGHRIPDGFVVGGEVLRPGRYGRLEPTP